MGKRLGIYWLFLLYCGIIACIVHPPWWPIEAWALGLTVFGFASFAILTGI